MPSGGNAAAAAAAAAKQLEEKNPVLQLNDMRKDCVYELLQEDGPSHEKRFTFKLRIDGKTFDGAGPTKKAAKAAAATQALKHPAVNANASKFKAHNGDTSEADRDSPPLHDLTAINAAISLGSPCVQSISPMLPQEGSGFLLMDDGEANYLERKRKLELEVLEMKLQANMAMRDYYKRKMALMEK